MQTLYGNNKWTMGCLHPPYICSLWSDLLSAYLGLCFSRTHPSIIVTKMNSAMNLFSSLSPFLCLRKSIDKRVLMTCATNAKDFCGPLIKPLPRTTQFSRTISTPLVPCRTLAQHKRVFISHRPTKTGKGASPEIWSSNSMKTRLFSLTRCDLLLKLLHF